MSLQESFATASGHWYAGDGSPAYQIIGKNGKLRNTTLRDARELNLRPSVTTILKCADKPALTTWLVNQAMDACLTLPQLDGETADDFKRRALADSKQQSIKAAEAGTELHGSLEKGFRGDAVPVHHRPHMAAAQTALLSIGLPGPWDAERSFACEAFGGKLDLSCSAGDGVVLDFKSKPFIEADKNYAYDEHLMQLAAYARGMNLPRAKLVNLFVGLTDAKVAIKVWTPEESAEGWEMFNCLLNFWTIKNHFGFEKLRIAA